MIKHLRLFSTLLLLAVASMAWGQTTVTDELNFSNLGLPDSGTGYVEFSEKSFPSGAVYAGNAASNNGECIQ